MNISILYIFYELPIENQRSGQFKQKLPHKKLPQSWQSVPKQSFSKNCKEEN